MIVINLCLLLPQNHNVSCIIMTIGTLNIDWAKKYKSKTHIHKIEDCLNTLNSDILIVTESVDLNLSIYNFIYKTKTLPKDQKYEELDYSKYLNKESAYRVTIYSKYQSSKSFEVSDPYTSICNQFETDIGNITIYATIIGTWFKKKPYAEKELHNCINDCMRIYDQTNSLCLAGDLNTSFKLNEKQLQINDETTKRLTDLCNFCQLDLTTIDIEKNIDHIFLPKYLTSSFKCASSIFVEKDILSDHKGILIDIQEQHSS